MNTSTGYTPSHIPAVRSSERTDHELLEATRGGQGEAFGELYERYAAMTRRIARRSGVATSDVDDIVADAWARVLRALRTGSGPTTNFPGYVATAVRRVAWSYDTAASMVSPTDDDRLLDGVWLDELDPSFAETELGQALLRLPRNWREILWRVEVDGEQVALLAAEFGKTPNSVSAIASRARRRLREELGARQATAADADNAVLEGVA